MEKIKRSLETENNVAMDTMKSKMVVMQHSHKKTFDSIKKQFQLEYQRINNEMKDLKERSLNSTEVQVLLIRPCTNCTFSGFQTIMIKKKLLVGKDFSNSMLTTF